MAAIAASYQALANNGGINSFLTCAWDLDGSEVLDALVSVGALNAAAEFERVLRELGVEVAPSSQQERFDLLEQHWTDALDSYDVLSVETDADLTRALERHVREHEKFYLTLKMVTNQTGNS